MTTTPARTDGAGNSAMRPSGRGKTGASIFLIVCAGYFIVPLIWLGFAVTKSNAGLFSSFGFWFDHSINLVQNLQDLLARDHGAFPKWMQNTFIYAVTASVGSAIISTLAGYAFAMYRFRGRRVLFAIVLGSVFVPATILAVPLYFLISQSGLSNSLLASLADIGGMVLAEALEAECLRIRQEEVRRS